MSQRERQATEGDRKLPIEVYARTGSDSVRVCVALEEACLPYLLLVEPEAGVNGSPQPAGSILTMRKPLIVDRGMDDAAIIMTQSMATLFYIAGEAPGSLMPVKNRRERALTYDRLFLLSCDTAPTELYDDQKAAAHRLPAALIFAEKFLADAPFMAGRRFSLADIVAFTTALAWQSILDWDTLPCLRRWFAAMASRPPVQRAMAALEVSSSGFMKGNGRGAFTSH
jgi:GST-like protein